ncbi:MAG: hypothetical protein SX243_24335 [Acidobacteriota bacterium]|nr:hypothetical protein [Acidobacteriota bacterium]
MSDYKHPKLLPSLLACGLLTSWSWGCTPPAPPPTTPPPYVPPTVSPPRDAGTVVEDEEGEGARDRDDAPAVIPRVVEINPRAPGDDGTPLTLVEAAEAERRRRSRETDREPIAVITNDNLKELGEGVELTFVEEDPDAAAEAADVTDREAAEAYWRDRIYEARLALRQAVDEKAEVEEEAARLRRRFYSEDDPFVRDGRIKPEWDRALDRLRELDRDILAHRLEVDSLLEEARAADAEPGWLDAGAELEPSFDDEEEVPPGELPAHEVLDPPTDDGT